MRFLRIIDKFFIIFFFIIILLESFSFPREIFSYNYSRIDKHALNTPKHVESSIETLAKYLIKPAKNDLEKVRAIYRWITANISYNTGAYFSGIYGSTSAEDVLESRSSICEGYSDLFFELAKIAGIEVVKISGYAKGYSYKIGDKFTGTTNHSWNAVKINGKWRLIDSTWGSGYVNEFGNFVREYDEFYFLTPPEYLIYTHFPEDKKWQLLPNPITKEQFEGLPFVKPPFFKNGLKFVSHKKALIQANSYLKVILSAPRDVLIIANLLQDDIELKDLTFVQRNKDNYEINVVFPYSGEYILRIFTKRKSDPGLYDWTLDYKIRSSGSQGKLVGFPTTYEPFIKRNAYLYSPLSGNLRLYSRQNFKIRVPDAREVVVIVGRRWVFLNKKGDIFTGEVFIDDTEVTVYAKFPGERLYSGLLRYEVYLD